MKYRYRVCLLLLNLIVFIAICLYTNRYSVSFRNVPVSTKTVISYTKVKTLTPKICSDDIELLILIPSTTWNFKQRDAIRRTWGNAKSSDAKTKVVFFTGQCINDTLQKVLVEEMALYRDVVQENIKESYQTLTEKSIALLRWASSNCPKVTYALKTDDDMFINIQNLVNVLRKRKPTKAILGVKNSHSSPFRDKRSKWYVSREQYSKDRYPPYISGTAYVMTGDIISALYNSTRHVPLLFIEDVYITGICREQIGAEAIYLPGFDSYKSNGKINGKNFEKRITGHHFSPKDIIQMWDELMRE